MTKNIKWEVKEKIILWTQIVAEMYKKGINVDGKICDEKFRRMKTNYTKFMINRNKLEEGL